MDVIRDMRMHIHGGMKRAAHRANASTCI
jgi:hypothetical protein